MHTLMELLKKEKLSCVIEQQGTIYKETSRGIAPILKLLDEGKLKDAFLADKVIGKAAAMMMVYGGVKEIDTILISEPAYQFLKSHDIPTLYETIVPYIINRTNDGMCPMEETVLYMEDMKEAHRALIEKLSQMKKMPTI